MVMTEARPVPRCQECGYPMPGLGAMYAGMPVSCASCLASRRAEFAYAPALVTLPHPQQNRMTEVITFGSGGGASPEPKTYASDPRGEDVAEARAILAKVNERVPAIRSAIARAAIAPRELKPGAGTRDRKPPTETPEKRPHRRAIPAAVEPDPSIEGLETLAQIAQRSGYSISHVLSVKRAEAIEPAVIARGRGRLGFYRPEDFAPHLGAGLAKVGRPPQSPSPRGTLRTLDEIATHFSVKRATVADIQRIHSIACVYVAGGRGRAYYQLSEFEPYLWRQH